MSEMQQEDRSNPGAELHQNPEAQQSTDLAVNDVGTQPIYSNFCRVTATPEEIFLDFGLNPEPFAAGRQDVRANPRVVINLFTAKRLLAAMAMTVQRHEATFGVIELDARRRAIVHQTTLSQVDASVPARTPDVIRLNR